jgi:hypothetical protein
MKKPDRTLLGDADDSNKMCSLKDRPVRSRGDGVQYPERFEEARERPPWTSEAWAALDQICGKSMPDEVKLRLAVDVSDFVEGNFFSHAVPKKRTATLKKMKELEEQCRQLAEMLKNDDEVRSLKGARFADALTTKVEDLAVSAGAAVRIKSEEKSFDKSRANTRVQDLLLYNLTQYFLASGAPLKLTRDAYKGKRAGVFADYLHLIGSLFPKSVMSTQVETFVRRGFDIAKELRPAQRDR